MYSILLFSHSLIRWLVLATVMATLIRSYYGWLLMKPFTRSDNILSIATFSAVQIQATIGIILYCISPVVKYFFNNLKEGVHEKEFRFFGMEHSLMMLTAVVLISIASITCKRKIHTRKNLKHLQYGFPSQY